jgi:general secretion pathway protein D
MNLTLKISLAILLLLLVGSAAMAESPKSLWKKGVNAEAHKDYEVAYQYYKAAYDKRPGDLTYSVAFERTRFLAAASKIKRAQAMREQGQLQPALQLFMKAAQIDPSNDLARQEMLRTEDQIKQLQGAEKPGSPQSAERAKSQSLEDAEGPVELCSISNAPLEALKLSGDIKALYGTLTRIAGLNVLFDPDFTSHPLSLELRGVTVHEALNILALESHTFWRPVTPNTIFVAADNVGKRRELDENAIQTFYLGHAATPTDMQDIVSAIRSIVDVQRIQQVPSQSAIVIRGTPSQLAVAQKMIDDFDRLKPEVVVDVIVAQVRHDKVRDIGVLPPQTASVALQGSSSTGTGNNSNNLTFNSLQHLNSTNYGLSLTPVQAQLLLTDSNTKILEKPQLRATDGIKATLKVGDRIPVATGSFGTPVGLANGAQLGVNTQFNYIDVGVKIDVTPRVEADNDVNLKVTLEISNVSSEQSLGGITQPVISQRTVDHEIQLRDGEINLLGGILEEQTVLNTNGVPVLSKIPVLKHLFSQEDKEQHTNEVVFLLVPHIVRGRFLSALNEKRLDVGAGNNIELRFPEEAARAAKRADRPCITPVRAASPVSSQPPDPATPPEQPLSSTPALSFQP